MNYYERWCADYVKKTLGLRMLEHGAYTMLLDAYYIANGPLPDHLPTLFSVCKAMTSSERDAVRKIVADYFPVGSDGMRHNERADEEIAKAFKRIEVARVNGKSGGRPPKNNPRGSVQKPNGEPAAKANGNPHETSSCTTRQGKALPEDLRSSSSGDDAPDSTIDLAGRKPDPKVDKTRAMRAEAVAILTFLNEKTGRNYEPVPANVDMVVSLLKTGATPLKVRQVIAKKTREWKGTEQDQYLRPKTLFSRTNFANYAGEIVEVPDDEVAEQEGAAQ